MSDTPRQVPIAVVGLAALFPGSLDVAGFWRDIVTGRDLITEVPPTHWLLDDYYDPAPATPDKTYCKRGAFLSPVEFDPLEFGIPPTTLPETDTSQLLSLLLAKKVLDEVSRGDLGSLDRERVSVILGLTSAQEACISAASRIQRPIWVKALRESGVAESQVDLICNRIASSYIEWKEALFPGLLSNVVAGRIANRFDLHGTNMTTDAACASALAAVSAAIDELALGKSDLALAGGVDTNNDIFTFMCFSRTPALSPTGDCRPFSDASDGTVLGEGLGMVALKRLSDAERDQDRIYAVIRGVGSSSDGRSKSIYGPLADGQMRALRRAYESAGYGPRTVQLVEAHGTGTKAGDVAEFQSLVSVFQPEDDGYGTRPWCALGSVKSQIGHTKGAAGIAGLLKVILAVQHKVLPPTIKVDRPNPVLAIEQSPFYLNTRSRPWIQEQGQPRRASVSSFGFGGTNYHVTIEEYVPSVPERTALRMWTAPTELVVLSGPSVAEVAVRLKALLVERNLSSSAYHSQLSFRASEPVRVAIVAESLDDLAGKVARAEASLSAPDATSAGIPPGVFVSSQPRLEGRVAFLFPGQGSQYVGMGADAAMAFDPARCVWDAAAGLRFDDRALHELVHPMPVFDAETAAAQDERLRATEWAQPAIGLASAAMLELLRELGVRADCAGGHSFGELTALYAAGVFEASDFLKVARRRGELMRDAAQARAGAMLSVRCGDEALRAIIASAGVDVALANYNGPEDIVVSGPLEAVLALGRALEENGVAAVRLPVAAAFHSPAVAPAVAAFAELLAQVSLKPPAFDVYRNGDGQVYPEDVEAVRKTLSEQLASPVRFADEIEAMYAGGARVFVEVGPGGVLTSLVRRILGGRTHVAVATDRKERHGVTSLQQALGQLAVAGVPFSFAPLWQGYSSPPSTPEPRSGAVKLLGINYGKPYPPLGGSRSLPPPNIHPVQTVMPRAPDEARHEMPLANAPTTRREGPAAAPGGVTSEASSVHYAWIQAYQEGQRQAADAHAVVQRAMADSLTAFLKASEGSFAGLASMLSAVAGVPAAAGPAPAPDSQGTAPRVAPQLPQAVLPVVPAPPASAARPRAASSLQQMLLTIIADKTGYQASLLNPRMELEADLGIDSIKRVEILAAVRDELPDLPEVAIAEFASLRTVADVVGMLSTLGRSAAPLPDTPEALARPPLAGRASEAPAARAAGLGACAAETRAGSVAALWTGGSEPSAPTAPCTPSPAADLRSLAGLAAAPGSLGEMATLGTAGERAEHLRGHRRAEAEDLSQRGVVAAAMESSPVVPPIGLALERLTPALLEERPVGLSIGGLHAGGRIVVTDDGWGVAAELVRILAEKGVQCELAGDEVPADADGVVFLGGLRRVPSIDEAIAVNRAAFGAARRVALRFAKGTHFFVTVQDTGGDFGMSGEDPTRAWLGGVAALVRTARHEWPQAALKAIDCACGGRGATEVAAEIARELLMGGGTGDVGLALDGRRLRRRFLPAPRVTGGDLAVDRQSVVVATGGGRGITAACLVELAHTCGPRIAILGRTALADEPPSCTDLTDEPGVVRALLADAQREGRTVTPSSASARAKAVLANREVRRTLGALRAAGSEARYFNVDVQVAAGVDAALRQVRAEWGPISVLVHGAGVLADKRISDQTDAQFNRVFDTKVAGLRALLAATAADPLAWICLFSSFAAHAGNAGQCAYAMANEVLNQVALAERTRRGGRSVVRAIGWGPWDGGMVTAALSRQFKARGVPLIPVTSGAISFVGESARAAPEVVVAMGGGSSPADGMTDEGSGLSEVLLTGLSHPYLLDHVIGGSPVVPVAMAVEWLLRAACTHRPDRTVTALHDIRVRRGVKLRDLGHRDRITVHCRHIRPELGMGLTLELRDASHTVCVSARASLAQQARVAPHALVPSALESLHREPIYDGVELFHGPLFQVIRGIDGVTSNGMQVTMSSPVATHWPKEPWQIDPAILDGAVQVATLWANRLLQAATLPMGVDTVELYHRGIADGPLRAAARTRSVGKARAICDVDVFDSDGRTLYALLAIECVVRPDLPPRGVGSVARDPGLL